MRYSRSELDKLIDEWILGRNAERDRKILRRRSYDSGLADELHEIMDKAPDESVKRDIKRAIDKIERM